MTENMYIYPPVRSGEVASSFNYQYFGLPQHHSSALSLQLYSVPLKYVQQSYAESFLGAKLLLVLRLNTVEIKSLPKHQGSNFFPEDVLIK